MDLFKKLFTSRNHAPATQEHAVEEAPVASPVMVDRDLFVELEEPKAAPVAPKPTRLKLLADQDLTEVGRQAGYDYHDPDMCRKMAERFKAELVRALDEDLDQIGFSIGRLDMEMRRLQGEQAMGSAYRALEAQKEMLERHRMKLQEQQFLIAGNSGYAELPMASFHAGYQQGYTAYLQETQLLNQYLA